MPLGKCPLEACVLDIRIITTVGVGFIVVAVLVKTVAVVVVVVGGFNEHTGTQCENISVYFKVHRPP